MRFFAFFSVFVHHGPALYPQAHAALWKIETARAFMLARAAGGFGMSMFFLLSSYLITELLLREQRTTGAVHLKAFYVRRILRIWPLYFLAVGLAVVLGELIPDPYHLGSRALLAFLIFAVAWLPNGSASPFNVLWSIGVEEQFYLLWPMLAKNGGARTIRRASYIVVVISFGTMILYASTGGQLWYNPFVEFLFFAVGGLLSIGLHGRTWNLRSRSRWLLVGAGIVCWLLAQHIGHVSDPPTPPPAWRDCTGYALAAVGSAAIFVSILGIREGLIPRPLLYLGKISYGLYVFHTTVLALTMRWLPRLPYEVVWAAAVYVIVLPVTISIAALSYKYFELPFLRLKAKFEFVKTR